MMHLSSPSHSTCTKRRILLAFTSRSGALPPDNHTEGQMTENGEIGVHEAACRKRKMILGKEAVVSVVHRA